MRRNKQHLSSIIGQAANVRCPLFPQQLTFTKAAVPSTSGRATIKRMSAAGTLDDSSRDIAPVSRYLTSCSSNRWLLGKLDKVMVAAGVVATPLSPGNSNYRPKRSHTWTS